MRRTQSRRFAGSFISSITFILLAVLLFSCRADSPETETLTESATVPAHVETEATGAADTEVPGFEDYVFQYTDPRNRVWEEDIVYMANSYLTRHPKITDTYFFEMRYYIEDPGSFLVNDNIHYDETLRAQFINDIHHLIQRIPELSDTEILYEAQRIAALLQDGHSNVTLPQQDFFPVMIKQLEQEGEMGYYALRVPKEYTHLLYTRLTAINSVDIEEIMDKLRPYISRENTYWEEYKLWDMRWDSLLVQQDALQIISVVGKEDNTAEFTFTAEDGSTTTVTLTAISYDEYDPADMAREDFLARKIGAEKYSSEKIYWYEELPEENMLYVRITKCYEAEDYSFDNFFWDVTDVLNAASAPLTLVIDLRGNTGGSFPMGGFLKFADRLQKTETDGIYVLIDHGVFSSGIATVGYLVDRIPDILLVGTPAGQPINMWGNPKYYDAPNGNLRFRISQQFWMFSEIAEDDALTPDITVCQTLEDYKLGIDTVLEYVKVLNK